LRRECASYLERHADERSDLFGAQLILGELLGNAEGTLAVSIDWSDEQAVLLVRDRGPGFSLECEPMLPDDPLAESGRGLYLVNALAMSVEIAAHPNGGSETRVVLPVSRHTENAPLKQSLSAGSRA